MGEHRSTRLAYYKGKLELMTPLWGHEDSKRVIERLIDTFTEEINKEPDSCYYIQNEARVRGKKEIDLTQYLPPDLALE